MPSQDTLIVLINELMKGPTPRRAAAKFLLDCLRRSRTKEEVANCLQEFEREAAEAVAREVRTLASDLRIVD
jgi:hypothetical protein